jgi:hypothetical protein
VTVSPIGGWPRVSRDYISHRVVASGELWPQENRGLGGSLSGVPASRRLQLSARP